MGGPLHRGIVTEGSHCGLFIVRRGVLLTREDGPHILPSVTQGLVLEIAVELNVRVERRPFTLDEMLGADEVFLAGTTLEVMPVARIDDAAVADGKPGTITKRLRAAYLDRVKRGDDAPRT